jgi:ribosomal protein S18 acetylase RimI-like enzyme
MVNSSLRSDIHGAMQPTITFRAAQPGDIDTLLDLMMVSSWGGIRKAWERVRAPHETWRDRGLAELADAQCEIGYPRFVVAEADGRLGAMVLLNSIGDTNGLNPALEPPEQSGAVALIREARFSVFIRELAVADWMRGRGIARSFLDLSERIAHSNGLKRTSLIVNDSNRPAQKLYESVGFRMIDSRPSIGHPAFDDGSMLLLMVKDLGDA